MTKKNWFTGMFGGGADQAGTGDAASAASVTVIASPLTGRMIPLSEVKDAMFSTGVMGPGAAVVPTVGELRAPFDGTVQGLFPTGHAVGLVSAGGVEILLHIGIDTVDLGGDHFRAVVENGQHVRRGDLLIEFDPEAIAAAGLEISTPVIALGGEDGVTVVGAPGPITAGDALIEVAR